MNILLVGERPDTRQILHLMLEKSRHRLEGRSLEDFPEPDLEAYDMVLVDGNACDCARQAHLLDWIREARRRYPSLPVAVMNCVGSHVAGVGGADTASKDCKTGGGTSHVCGVSESADGVWSMRCRLQELALSETAALLRDACERPPLEPITFEYSGPN